MQVVHLEAEDLRQVWIDFKDVETAYIGPITFAEYEHRIVLRNQLMLHYASLVRFVATKIGKRLPGSVERDDLISSGMFGLMDAMEKFQLAKNVKFETYGIPRIHGTIMDDLRKQDWVPRTVRTRARNIEEARAKVEDIHGKVTNQLLARHLKIGDHDLRAILDISTVAHVESLAGAYEVVEISDMAMNPEDIVETGEVADLLGEAVGNMDERSKIILTLYYVHEMTLAEIGKILGVTESRVCQLQSKVLVTLRETLGHGGLAA